MKKETFLGCLENKYGTKARIEDILAIFTMEEYIT